MDLSKLKATINILLVGGVIGFFFGAWAVQNTHLSPAAASTPNGTDLTNSAILSSLSRINQKCAQLQVSTEHAREDATSQASLNHEASADLMSAVRNGR